MRTPKSLRTAHEKAMVDAFCSCRRRRFFSDTKPATHAASGDEKKLCKALAKGKAIGLEFGGPGCMQMLRSVMPPGDFICTSSSQASSTFRYMGIEG